MEPMRRLFGAAAALTTLVAVACGGAAAPTPTPTKAPPTPIPSAAPLATSTRVSATPAPAQTPTTAPTAAATLSAGKPQPSGKLVVAVSSLLDEVLDAHKQTGGFTPTMYDHLYDSLFYPREDGKTDVRFATSWQTAPDGMSYTFGIRTNAKFHDGTPVTANDVAESINRYVAINISGDLRARFAKAEAIAPDRVKLTAKQLDPTPLPLFYIEPIDYIRRLGDMDGKAGTFAKAPIGSGAFKFKEQRLQESLFFTAFSEHWGEGPFVKDVEVRIIPENVVRVASLKAGETAIVDGLAGVLAEQVQNTAGLRTRKVVGSGTAHIDFRDISDPKAPKNSPFLDKRVRLALNYAIDKEALRKSIWRDQFLPKYSIYRPGAVGWRQGPDPFAYDLSKAKQLLQEAGFPNGFSTTIYVTVSGSTPLTVETTEAVASMWEKIGVKAQYIRMESGTFFAKVRDRTLGPLWMMSWGGGGGDDGGTTAKGFFTDGAVYATYFDAVTEDLRRRQATTIDPRQREAVLDELNRYILDNAYMIPLYDAATFVGLSDKVVEYKLPEYYPYISALWTVKLKK